MLAEMKPAWFETPDGSSSGPPVWVNELISRLDDDLLGQANTEYDLSGEPVEEQVESDTVIPGIPPPPADPSGNLPAAPVASADARMLDPDGQPGHGPVGMESSLPPGSGAGQSPAGDEGGFLESVFGWLGDLFSSIFGAPVGDDVAETPPPPASYVPDPPPDMSNDVVFIEYIPETPSDEAVPDPDDPGEEDFAVF